MSPAKILIFTAVELEANAVASATRTCLIVQNAGAIGIRASRLGDVRPGSAVSTVILCGLAGALNPSLGIGDLILNDPGKMVPGEIEIPRGTIYSSSAIAATPADKAAMFRQTRADAVDMEQAIVQTWCDARGFSLISLRAISDTADETLDPVVLRFVDDLGRPLPGKIAAGLLRNPLLVPHLLRLNRNSKIALARLADAVRTVVAALDC